MDKLADFRCLAQGEGTTQALDLAQAVAEAIRLVPKMKKDQILAINLSGRGDKDCLDVARCWMIGTLATPIWAAPG